MKLKLPTKGQLAAAAVQDYCRRMGYPVPAVEYQFIPSRRFRFDVAWFPERIALEFQGGSWTGGGHTRGMGFERDCEKFSEAASRGWRVLLATYAQLNRGDVFGWIDRIFGNEHES